MTDKIDIVKRPISAPLSVCGVSRTHAERAIRRLRNGGILAFYYPAEKALCTFELKFGRLATYQVLRHALEATRRKR
jgi:hypothetical protein